MPKNNKMVKPIILVIDKKKANLLVMEALFDDCE
jgi:hypothetical protein